MLLRRVGVMLALLLTSGCVTTGVELPNAVVEISDDLARPSVLSVAVETIVTFRNVGRETHLLTFGDVSLRSPPGSAAERSFEQIGVHAYECEFHSAVRGTIRVVAVE